MSVKVKSGTGAGGYAWNTAHPAGDTPSASGAFQVFGSLTDDGQITIVAGDGTDFGQYGPELVMRTRFQGCTAGADYEPVRGVTYEAGVGLKTDVYWRGSGAINKQPIHAVAELPYGKGFAIGTLDTLDSGVMSGSMSSNFRRESPEFFEHMLMYYPPDNVTNVYNTVFTNYNDGRIYSWQDKQSWYMRWGSEGSYETSKDMDIYSGWNSLNPGNAGDVPPYSTKSYKTSKMMFASNCSLHYNDGSGDQITSKYFNTYSGCPFTVTDGPTPKDNNGKTQRTNICIQQTSCGMYGPGQGWIDGEIIDTTTGVIVKESQVYPFQPSRSPYFSQNRWPGFIRGFSIPNQWHFYVADRYMAIGNGPNGEGSRARVTLTDAATRGARKKEAIMTIDHWSPKLIKATIKLGLFWNASSLSGLYIHIYNYQGAFVGAVQI